MTHKPILLDNVAFVLPHKTCFADFKQIILAGQRIAVVGKNGCGKSTLLKIIAKIIQPSSGKVKIAQDIRIGFIPQTPLEKMPLSGGQQFNRLLDEALVLSPSLLLLDEPTNHLDVKNRRALLDRLHSFSQTLIIATHDTRLVDETCDILWHIDEGRIHVFAGNYDDYRREIARRRASVEKKIDHLNKIARDAHHALMKEQARAKSSRQMGEKNITNRKWPTIVSTAKATRAEMTTGRKKSALLEKRCELSTELSSLRLPEIITPKFHMMSSTNRHGVVMTIENGAVGYESNLLENINFIVRAGERVAISGDNGAGKSTLLKALARDSHVTSSGNFMVASSTKIGYLDQSYDNLVDEITVLKTISDTRPDWTHQELRRHLNNFLFRKNEEVNALINTLSGGERARLSLAKIAANSPSVLLLDEITNNIDLETRTHVIEILKEFKGTLVVISHDEDFLRAIDIERILLLRNGTIECDNFC